MHTDTGSRWRHLYRYHRSDRVHWHTRLYLWREEENLESSSAPTRASTLDTFRFTCTCLAETIYRSAQDYIYLVTGEKELWVLAESRPVWCAGLLRINSNCTYIVTGSGRRNQDTFTKISKGYIQLNGLDAHLLYVLCSRCLCCSCIIVKRFMSKGDGALSKSFIIIIIVVVVVVVALVD